MLEKMYSPEEISSLLNISVATIYRWIKAGRLNAVKISNKVYRISEKSVKEFLENNK